MILYTWIVIIAFIGLLVAFICFSVHLTNKYYRFYEEERIGEKIIIKLIEKAGKSLNYAQHLARSSRNISMESVDLDIPIVQVVEIKLPNANGMINESVTSFYEDEKKTVDNVKEYKTLEAPYSFVFQEN